MELTNINWADIALFVTSVASLVKAFKSGSDATKAKNEAAQIRADRDTTKAQRDHDTNQLRTEIEVLKERSDTQEKMLESGNGRFERIEGKMDEMAVKIGENNSLLSRFIGKLDTFMAMARVPQHQEEGK